MLRLFEGPQCFFEFSPNVPSISPGEKCARSSRTCNRTPAGVGFSLDRVFVEGSAASIAAGFIGGKRRTRDARQHKADDNASGGRMQPGLRWRRWIRLSRCRVPREGTDVRLRW